MDNHQFDLFNFDENKPKGKVPISAEKIKQARDMINQRNDKGALQKLREINDGLEIFLAKISNKKKP